LIQLRDRSNDLATQLNSKHTMKNLSFAPRSAAALCLIAVLALASPDVFAQQRPGGGGFGGSGFGGGGFGGFGGFGGGGGGGGRQTGTYPSNTRVGEALITFDPETRQIIVITDDETNEHVKTVLKSLDRPKPQALIRVVFVEVTYTDDLNLGVQGKLKHDINNTQGGEIFSLLGVPGGVGTDRGLFYKILPVGANVELTVNALSQLAKTEVLSRPTILARNNQQATIVVGQEYPFITNTRFDQNGGQINTVQYQDIGIILRVTPFISSEGLIEMIVSPEISKVSAQTIPISTNVVVNAIDKISADTVVVTESGKTVVIGGLIKTDKRDTKTKVPLLGDIPLIGAAFSRKEKRDVKTELLIFLTPEVVHKPGDLLEASTREAGRLDLPRKAFSEQELNQVLDNTVPPPNGASKPPANGAKRTVEQPQSSTSAAPPKPRSVSPSLPGRK
jgi:general secretion pathway protein D